MAYGTEHPPFAAVQPGRCAAGARYSAVAAAVMALVVCAMAAAARGHPSSLAVASAAAQARPVPKAPAARAARPTAGRARGRRPSGARTASVSAPQGPAPVPSTAPSAIRSPFALGGLLAIAAAAAAAAAGALWAAARRHPPALIHVDLAPPRGDAPVAARASSGRRTAPQAPAVARRAFLAAPIAAAPLLRPPRARAFLPTFPDTPLRGSIDVAAEARFLIKRRDGRAALSDAEERVLRAPVTQRTLLRYGGDKARLRDAMIAAADAARRAEEGLAGAAGP